MIGRLCVYTPVALFYRILFQIDVKVDTFFSLLAARKGGHQRHECKLTVTTDDVLNAFATLQATTSISPTNWAYNTIFANALS